MKKLIYGLIIALGLAGSVLVPLPALAATDCADGDRNCVETSIIGGGSYTDDGDGSGIVMILNIILTILTWGIGIAATIGIVISAIQYLTARDSEQQVAAAKNRILQIVIGLACYAALWAGLQWLIPGGVL